MADSQTQPGTAQARCAMCSNVSTQKCASCGEIKYCSKQCQRNDWPIHKILCKTFKDFSDPQRPGPDYKHAIRFPKNGEQPHFFWLQHVIKPELPSAPGVNNLVEVAALDTLEDVTDIEHNGEISVFSSDILRRPVEHIFEIMGKFREGNCSDNIPANEINQSLLNIDRELQDVWYGDIVAYSLHHTSQKHALDMGPMEFRHAVDKLRQKYDYAQRQRQSIVQGPSVSDIRFANVADVYLGRCQAYEKLPVSAAQCTSKSDYDTPICDRIGIPIVLH